MNLYNHNYQQANLGNPQSGGDNATGQNFFPVPKVTPELLYGINEARKFLPTSNQTDKWKSGASGFFLSLKYYFAVDNIYVYRKLLTILYPVANKTWSRVPADDFERTDESDSYSRKWASPRQDLNSPDLYIPLMSFITYVLLYGMSRAIQVGKSGFSPDVIIQSIWRCLLLQLIETCLIKFAINSLGATVPVIDVFAYSGYKYVGLCINTFSRVFGGILNFLIALYTTGMLGFFVLKTTAAVVPANSSGTGPPRHVILLAIAAVQFVVMLILSWL